MLLLGLEESVIASLCQSFPAPRRVSSPRYVGYSLLPGGSHRLVMSVFPAPGRASSPHYVGYSCSWDLGGRLPIPTRGTMVVHIPCYIPCPGPFVGAPLPPWTMTRACTGMYRVCVPLMCVSFCTFDGLVDGSSVLYSVLREEVSRRERSLPGHQEGVLRPVWDKTAKSG